MGREIKFCLLYRDMWQSSGKYMPRVDQLTKVAGPIVDMGCWSRIETNGGGFEQINLLYGENPNKSLRAWTKAFNEAGIQTQMLERGLNGIRMSPVPPDVRQLMFKLKKIQGTDIARSFDGLNDTRNLELSIKYAKEGGMISQGALCLTHSELHTVDYYVNMAKTLIEMGTEEICLKDMAGIARPVSVGKIVKGIKKIKPDIVVDYHGHAGPGFQIASILEAANAGADIIDVGMEPLSWGTGHADLLAVQEMLKDAGFTVPDIDMKAYMKVRSLTQEFMDDFLGFYINPKNRLMNSLLIAPGLPGGMMGSLMADLENNLASLNKWLVKRNEPEISQDELLIKLFDEVKYVWPKLGYPPLVTPFSQYVKNVALMNVTQMHKGKERWSMIDDNTWDMVLGKSGKLAGPLGPEIIELAASQGREFYEGVPQDLYPNQLEEFKAKMQEKGWELGQDDEELFEYSMHPAQYEAYKSGKAKEDFEADLAKKKMPPVEETTAAPKVAAPTTGSPRSLNIDVNGEKFLVSISYEDEGAQAAPAPVPTEAASSAASLPTNGELKEILAPVEGKFFLTKESSDTPVKIGDEVKEGDVIGYIEAMKVINAVSSTQQGKIVEICSQHGDDVEEDDVLMKVQ